MKLQRKECGTLMIDPIFLFGCTPRFVCLTTRWGFLISSPGPRFHGEGGAWPVQMCSEFLLKNPKSNLKL